MDPPQRPKCKNCERYVDSLLARLKEEEEENERLSKQNSEEKKRHSEVNNEIIMSNVKYQQALQQTHTLVLKYTREREEFIRKEASTATLQAELQTVWNVNKQLMDRLQSKNSGDLPKLKTESSNKSRVDAVNTQANQKNKGVGLNKGLHVRTESEANSETYLSVATKMLKAKPSPQASKGIKSKEAPKSKNDTKIQVFEDPGDSESAHNTSTDSNMSLDYSDDEDDHNQEKQLHQDNKETTFSKDKHPTVQQSKKNVNKEKLDRGVGKESKNQDSKKNDEFQGKYQFRRTIAKGSYAEPSLRVKMRRGDNHPNIIPEYVVRPFPYLITDDENVPP